MMKASNIYQLTLEKYFGKALEIVNSGEKKEFLSSKMNNDQLTLVTNIIEKIEKQKSVLAVLITSLIKKIVDQDQDIRLHREEFSRGYSGRTLDTNVITPWLKREFPRYAPKESGWLTRSIEQPHPFTLDFPGKIRDKQVKQSFLSILDDIEVNRASPSNYLITLFIFLIEKKKAELTTAAHIMDKANKHFLTINQVISLLNDCFSLPNSSRLPVVAIYSVYQILIKEVDFYKNAILNPLKSHTTSDRYSGYGDIELYDKEGNPFEIVEIKHNIPIDPMMISDVLRKVEGTKIRRYLILTTHEPNFSETDSQIYDLVNKIKSQYAIDIIPNGVMPTLKYYLRLINNLEEFIELFVANIKAEFESSTDIKHSHLRKIMDIINEYSRRE